MVFGFPAGFEGQDLVQSGRRFRRPSPADQCENCGNRCVHGIAGGRRRPAAAQANTQAECCDHGARFLTPMFLQNPVFHITAASAIFQQSLTEILEMPTSVSPQSGTLVQIATGSGHGETCAVVSFLEGYGLHPVVLGFQLCSVLWTHTTAFGGMPICVPSQEANAAIALLHSTMTESDATEGAPVCSSLQVIWHVVAMCLFFVPPPPRGVTYPDRVIFRSRSPLHPATNPV